MWQRFKQTWLWRHRTKAVGGLGIMGGSVQSFLAQHDKILPMKWQGISLMFFGGLVTAVGVYNQCKDYFGWTDDP